MEIKYKKIEDLKPYENNPRFNDDAVEYVAKSIKEFGFKVPLVITSGGVIITGHTRYKASLELGLKEVPCIIADDLTEEQIKAFRLVDNKASEISDWNFALLEDELNNLDIDMSDFGFNLDFNIDEEIEVEENPYTNKINIPQYEIKGEEPTINELVEDDKTNELLEKIEKANITQEQKDFLMKSATRHYGFNYSKIAEYYAHQDKEMQQLMEDSALVIIDYDNAIHNGYVELKQSINEMRDE